MKKVIIALSAMFLSLTTFAQKPINRIGVEGPLKFDKTQFNIAWTAQPNEKYWIQEYLPSGETVENFNQLLTINLFETDLKTKDAVKQKINELNTRKSTDPVCNNQVTESPDGKEFIVDFLLSESKDGNMTIVEFNVYKYNQIEISKNKKAIIVYAYSKRSYGENITEFLKNLKEDRIKYLNAMISSEIPSVSIEKK